MYVGWPDRLRRNDFVQVRDKTLAQPSDLEKLCDDIVEMHEGKRQEPGRSDKVYFDLEQGVGGIAGLEFMVQYAVLRWAHKHRELLAVTDNLRLLEILTRFGLIAAGTGIGLHNAYFAYRREVHRRALHEVDSLFRHERLDQAP